MRSSIFFHIKFLLILKILKQKLKREHHLKGTLRNQSNKHQNSQKPMLKAEQKNTSCMPKTAVSPNLKAHQ